MFRCQDCAAIFAETHGTPMEPIKSPLSKVPCAKCKAGLQRTLDVHQIIHNFIRPHWTTGKVPAVALGIIEGALCLKDILTMRLA